MIEFSQPVVLWFAALVPLWLMLALRRRGQGAPASWVLRHPQLGTATWQASPGQRLPLVWHALGFVLLITALAQPRQVGAWITPPPQGRDLALVIDPSLTMSLQDFALNDKPVSRMAMLKQVLADFVKARTADRFALLVFGSQAALLTPPTFDHAHVLAQLRRLQVGVAGDDTALGDALGLALKPLRQQQLRPAIILVSDGEPSNSGEMSPAEAVAVAHQLGVAIHTLEIGSASRAPAEPVAPDDRIEAAVAQPGLADIARLTGGQHWKIRSSADAQAVMQAIDQLEPTLARPAQAREVHEWFWIPLVLGIACLTVAQLLLIRRRGQP
jgi:Ca-activated chloride channel family protein